MTCNICGGTETYLQDGIEYCRECSEQIKGTLDEVGEESFTRRSLLSSPAKKGKKEEAKILSPWLYFEAYNLILSKQVEALIKLGCSEKLKTVVFCLWARYLHKCESAFVASGKEEFIPRLSIFASKRDIELLYGEGLSTNLIKLRRPNFPTYRRKVYKKRKPKTEVVEPDDANRSAHEISTTKSSSQSLMNQNNEFPTDSVVSTSEVSGDESSEPSLQNLKEIKKEKIPNVQYSSHAKKLKEEGYRRTDRIAQALCVSHMTLSKTLSFCQLGLLYTEDQMLLFDLIRLVNEGAVPYIDATRHFPTTMQIQANDRTYFNKCAAPDVRKVALTSAQLIDFLQLPKFKEPPLLPNAIRFLKDLNLPCDLIPVLKLLISKINKDFDEQLESKKSVKYKSRNIPLPFYEAQAMSAVLIALKMLFVLDGKFEVEHSEIMTKLNSISKDQTYFVWKDWQQQIALKEYLFIKKYSMNENTMNRLDTLSADRINAGYPICRIRQDLTTLANPELKNDNSTRIELDSLIKNLVIDSSNENIPTSFPLKNELHRLMKDWKKMHLFKDTENIDFSFISKDFSHHKLYYRPSAKTDEPMNLLLSSLYESVKLIHVTDRFDYYENIIRSSRKYWYLHYDSKNTKWENDFPSSFKWLFNFMCNYLQVDKFDFYKEFRYIERKLVCEP